MCYRVVNLLDIGGWGLSSVSQILSTSCLLDTEVESGAAWFQVLNIFEEHQLEECIHFVLTNECSIEEVRAVWVGQANKLETEQFINAQLPQSDA